jgi:hypothetical protein
MPMRGSAKEVSVYGCRRADLAPKPFENRAAFTDEKKRRSPKETALVTFAGRSSLSAASFTF